MNNYIMLLGNGDDAPDYHTTPSYHTTPYYHTTPSVYEPTGTLITCKKYTNTPNYKLEHK